MDWLSQNHLKCQKGKCCQLFVYIFKSKQINVCLLFYRSPLWTAVAYAAFDIATNPESKEAKNKAVSVCKKNYFQIC